MIRTTALAVALAAACFPFATRAQASELSLAARSMIRSVAATARSVDAIADASHDAQQQIGFPAVVDGTLKPTMPFHALVARYSAAYGVPLDLAHAVIQVESRYRPDARGSAGEVGLMQIKPATARGLGFRGATRALYDPETNIRYGMMYLGRARELGGGSVCGTILRYNAGHAARRMNPVSRAYCVKVQKILDS